MEHTIHERSHRIWDTALSVAFYTFVIVTIVGAALFAYGTVGGATARQPLRDLGRLMTVPALFVLMIPVVMSVVTYGYRGIAAVCAFLDIWHWKQQATEPLAVYPSLHSKPADPATRGLRSGLEHEALARAWIAGDNVNAQITEMKRVLNWRMVGKKRYMLDLPASDSQWTNVAEFENAIVQVILYLPNDVRKVFLNAKSLPVKLYRRLAYLATRLAKGIGGKNATRLRIVAPADHDLAIALNEEIRARFPTSLRGLVPQQIDAANIYPFVSMVIDETDIEDA